MKLQRFRVSNYRSVKDSGWVDAVQRTIVVGRNESGKSNLLLALASLKPPGKLERLNSSQDFPADLPPNSCTTDLGVVETVWTLSETERRELAQILPRSTDVTHVEVGRGYEPECWVRFPSEAESAAASSPSQVETTAPSPAVVIEGTVSPEVRARTEQAPVPDDDARDPYEAPPAKAFTDSVVTDDELAVLNGLGADTDPEFAPAAQRIEDGGPANEKEAREWVIKRLPTFLYVDEYPEVEGSQNLSDYVRLRQENRLEARHQYFEQLLSLAGLEPSVAETLLTADSGMRRRIASHAGRVVTQKLQQLWTDRALKVRFDLDGDQFNTLICDANSTFDVEINLNQRSRGFRWFFSFYVTFAAHSGEDGEDQTLLLLDEPAMHLHAVGQRDFLNQLTSNVNGQVILATQSPFLVPTDDLSCVRTVTITEERGTRVSNEPAGDSATMIPIVHALGAEVSKALLEGSWSLIVESLTDYWYLLGASNILRDAGSDAVPSNLSISPAGNSASVLYMTGLLSSGGIPAIVLQSSRSKVFEGLPGNLGDAPNVVFIGDALTEAFEHGADVEDLLDAQIYDRFVRMVHKKGLEERKLEFDSDITRIVPRYQDAFARAGLSFNRERVARGFMRMLLQKTDSVLPPKSRANFERLFATIRDRFETLRD
jgi:energy-coupling factor transporter ATP-binding protein EcfA2